MGSTLASVFRTIHSIKGTCGQILTALDLRYRLGLGEPGERETLMNVVVRNDDSSVSFLVDEIGEVLDVDETTFEAPPETLQGEMRALIGGAYKLDGRLLLALDTQRTIDSDGLKFAAG